jgi:hypothetical protein
MRTTFNPLTPKTMQTEKYIEVDSSQILDNDQVIRLISPKAFNWIRRNEIKVFQRKFRNTFIITDGKLEIVINLTQTASIIKPMGRAVNEIKAVFNESSK